MVLLWAALTFFFNSVLSLEQLNTLTKVKKVLFSSVDYRNILGNRSEKELLLGTLSLVKKNHKLNAISCFSSLSLLATHISLEEIYHLKINT